MGTNLLDTVKEAQNILQMLETRKLSIQDMVEVAAILRGILDSKLSVDTSKKIQGKSFDMIMQQMKATLNKGQACNMNKFMKLSKMN